MKKISPILIISVLLIIFIGIYIFTNFSNNNLKENPKVCFKENCFSVEIAKTQTEKTKGLMFRESLEESKGMIFIYNKEGIYNFWMKNTLIPLDIIWINTEKKVVYIKHKAQPCEEKCEILSPLKNAKFVLEINSGITEKLDITLGDKVEFYGIV